MVQFKKIEGNTIAYDTLYDGRLVYKGLPGQYERVIRQDNSNFMDGDYMSSMESGYGRALEDSAAAKFSMYNSVKRRFIVDGQGRVVLQKIQKTDLRTCLTLLE